MHPRPRAHTAAAVTLIAACTSPTLAAFSGFASSTASGIDSENSTDPQFALVTEKENLVGGHGYAEISLDFAAGVITGRNHACVGPTPPTSFDSAKGECSVFSSNETLTVTSDTLPLGTAVTIRFCADMSSQITGTANPKSLAGASQSITEMTLAINGNTINARHDTDQYWQNIDGSNAFNGQDTEFASAHNARTIQAKVGDTLAIFVSASSSTLASASSSPGVFPIADGSAGFAMTFGLESVTDGAKLLWNGAEWTGSCEPSLPLIPDNPVPSPSTTLLLWAAAAPPALRRRR